MTILFESPVGYSLVTFDTKVGFKEKASYTFPTPTDALLSYSTLGRGTVPADLLTFLGTNLSPGDMLTVTDPSVTKSLSSTNLGLMCRADPFLVRSLRSESTSLFSSSATAHSLANFSLNSSFSSAERLDVFVTESVVLLDTIDTDINMHVMRLKEWYSFHFPELEEKVLNNVDYCKAVSVIGRRGGDKFRKILESNNNKEEGKGLESTRDTESKCDTEGKRLVSDNNEANKRIKRNTEDDSNRRTKFLTNEKWEEIEKVALSSMGAEITENDCSKIVDDANSVIKMYEYKDNLVRYLNCKINEMAPNLVSLVGEWVALRLMAKAGSLMILSKLPSSTIQIMGAEKAFLNAVKSKSDTPKYGYLFHSPLISGCSANLKGKMARSLAAKAAIACRVDAFGEGIGNDFGLGARANLESRIKYLEQQRTKDNGSKRKRNK